MLNNSNALSAQVDHQVSTYTNLSGLQRINQLANKDQDAALKEVARQFESMFLNIMLKTMRSANEAFSEGGLFDSSEMEFRQQMFDDQLALTLASGRGIGLAEMFHRQMQSQYAGQDDLRQSLSRLQSGNQPMPSASMLPAKPAGEQSDEASDFSASPEAFVATLYPHARKAARQIGVAPELLLAQAALETGWGRHVAADADGKSSHNLFNIKADQRWQGPTVRVSTLEYREGIAQREHASFRRYRNVAESFSDYADFVQSQPRYRQALEQQDAEAYIRALHDAGYATDPSYADKVLRLLDTEAFRNAAADAADATPRG